MTGTLLAAVEAVARLAGTTAFGSFGCRLDVRTKSDGSPVTNADLAAERAAREWIAKRFPKDGVLGEELGETNAGAERRWLIDPIDGTRSFVAGVPLWGTLIAVARGDAVQAGAIYCPAVDEMVCAAPGEGCWWNGARARVSETADLRKALVLTSDPEFRASPGRASGWRALSERAGTVRSWGDCFGYLLVATGRAEAMVDGALSPWDSAALQPVITEAGGLFTDWSGTLTAFGNSAVATNALLAAEVRRRILEAETPR